ncbi:glutathione S-transferase family protein [Marinimicrobium sp. UBA4209]|jgi:glutathione S-transferase|uniref:glutathione S-transferase family protein n=1 Tax=Marinimicrobium sp. UBA4209 TaxID=1946810 RepID=UPI0025807110|nr:glutathione S-transferase family protein [Marinimicrobium sp. UBA4209]
MSMMTLYTNPQSRGRVVRWMLEEIGQPYDVKVMTFGGDIKSPEYLKLNPMGKVPTLTHKGTVITEVAAICAYLAEQFPEAGLAPALDSPERGSYHRWLFFVAGPFEMASSAKAYNWEITDEMAQAVGCGHIQDTLNAIEQTLTKQPYLCGDRFTTADLLMASYIGWETMMKVLEPNPVFAQYVERCESREAARRADKLDNALMEKIA